ncbi:MAG: acylphosphatase [Candidatus Zixiibacteriota bacterium]|nr:MAG: acylphosphatase [candidate division Zixibacteria bacterium]
MSSVAAELNIRGIVQGVGFRYFCYRRALELNLSGWARNNPDGSVSAHVEGARGDIEAYIADLKVGPRSASVQDVRVQWADFTGRYDRFDITV